MTTPDNNTPVDQAAQVGKAEKFNRGMRKARNTALSIWAYVFYGAILALGIWMVATGTVEGLIFIGVAVVLFALYWLFGYVVCCR
jgi:hypothetical protein